MRYEIRYKLTWNFPFIQKYIDCSKKQLFSDELAKFLYSSGYDLKKISFIGNRLTIIALWRDKDDKTKNRK